MEQLPALALSATVHVLPEDQVCDRDDGLFELLRVCALNIGDVKNSTNCSQPVTQANEAYGLLPTLPFEQLDNVMAAEMNF